MKTMWMGIAALPIVRACAPGATASAAIVTAPASATRLPSIETLPS